MLSARMMTAAPRLGPHRRRRAADDHHEHGERGRLEGEVRRHHACVVEGEQRAGDPGEDPADDQRDVLEGPGVVAQAPHPRLVRADADQRPAERRARDAMQDEEADDEADHHEVVVAEVVPVDLDEAEVGPRDTDQAVAPARHRVPLGGDDQQQLGERHRHQQEVHAGDPQAEVADARRQKRRDHERHRQHQPEGRPAVVDGEDAHHVAGHAEEGGPAERDEARVAHHQVEAHREDREDEDLGEHVLVVLTDDLRQHSSATSAMT